MHKKSNRSKSRCDWTKDDPIYLNYHDQEWGVPIHDERRLFEFLILEGMQAGLSWITILKKRDNYRTSFDNFDAEKIASYNQRKVKQLLANPGIIRNKLKINAVIANAQAFLQLKEQGQLFSDYIWHFVNGKPIQNHWRTTKQVPSTSSISDKLSKELKRRGFKFVGSTICYAFMQAVGMVNDHTINCFRYKQVKMKRMR